ncbi:expression site-associated gene (ESAG) protein, putative [Trypanosoma brucei brucei TREU927]|uniref:Expression site-associated gene (ESAG) protein, putative n=1 Tax=Trypanosoma brucei brucei (strain 927/4 GUTat10.1) TaxID=185431 RepID=Q38A27_TRYB2|nr:expression site-associated gene ESAG protein [Trypanosoma brucei brucei TREU927]EAN78343.1 expression site-associated gene (ESAG) protein, putative [Trypanosoma brucei brucei TREU927]
MLRRIKGISTRKKGGRLYLIVIALLIVVGVMATMDIRSSHTETGHGLRKENFHSSYAPRISYVVVQNRPSPGWCRMLLSSILTNVSVVTLGMGGWYGNVRRWTWIYNYVWRGEARESDVIVIFDGGDTFFTETHLREDAMKYFLATTPSTPEKFNETEIIQGAMTPPMLFTAEVYCAMPDIDIMVKHPRNTPPGKCRRFYERAFEASTRTGTRAILRMNESGRSYLNGGGVIARVWALREALEAFFRLKKQWFIWRCDQTMWAFVFLWSVTRPSNVKPKLFLRRGIMSLDYETRYFHYPYGKVIKRGAILHFAGSSNVWKETIPRYLSEMSWFKALKNSFTEREAYRRLLETTSVEIHSARGAFRYVKLGTVCPISNVSNPNWLSGELRK